MEPAVGLPAVHNDQRSSEVLVVSRVVVGRREEKESQPMDVFFRPNSSVRLIPENLVDVEDGRILLPFA